MATHIMYLHLYFLSQRYDWISCESITYLLKLIIFVSYKTVEKFISTPLNEKLTPDFLALYILYH